MLMTQTKTLSDNLPPAVKPGIRLLARELGLPGRYSHKLPSSFCGFSQGRCGCLHWAADASKQVSFKRVQQVSD